jgi:uncharacterized protein
MWTLIFLAALAIPTHTGYVTDVPNVLSLAQRSSLEAKLEEYEKSSTNEIAVLIIPSLQGEDLNDFANRVFHTWGIGKKGADNGVLLLWSTGDRKVRIEVGYGLESSLPDGRAGEIIRSAIIPAFRKAEWNSGLTAGINEIILATSAAPSAPSGPRSSSRLWIWLLLATGVVLIIAGIVIQTKRLEREREAQEERQRRRDADEYTAARRVSRLPYTPPAVLPLTERRRSSSSSSPIIIAPVPIPEPESESRSSSSSEESPSSSSSDSSFGFDSGSGSDSGSFGGGDSGGGGASGSY